MCGRKLERTSGRGRIRVPAKLDLKGVKDNGGSNSKQLVQVDRTPTIMNTYETPGHCTNRPQPLSKRRARQ